MQYADEQSMQYMQIYAVHAYICSKVMIFMQ